MTLYHHQNGDCSLTCRYCEWEDELERIERALTLAMLDDEADEP